SSLYMCLSIYLSQCFFLFLFRPPLLSPLFPYTTLFRSLLPASATGNSACCNVSGIMNTRQYGRTLTPTVVLYSAKEREARHEQRSEEHTSELQSRENLVCRLLLEKKKYQNTIAVQDAPH